MHAWSKTSKLVSISGASACKSRSGSAANDFKHHPSTAIKQPVHYAEPEDDGDDLAALVHAFDECVPLISYIRSYSLTALPSSAPPIVPPVTTFQQAFNHVCQLFLQYKQLVGVGYISDYFDDLVYGYQRDGDATVVIEADESIQHVLHRIHHCFTILELEADQSDLICVETGRHMVSEIAETAKITWNFWAAAIVGRDELKCQLENGSLKIGL